MSLTLLTAMSALRMIVGVAGVGYSIASGESREAIDFYDKAGQLWVGSILKGEDHLIPAYMKLFPNRIECLIVHSEWNRIAGDALQALQFLSLINNPDVPDYVKQQVGMECGRTLTLISDLSAEQQEEIYKSAGESGQVLKQFVDNFREAAGQ
jgi:hypothetical protein